MCARIIDTHMLTYTCRHTQMCVYTHAHAHTHIYVIFYLSIYLYIPCLSLLFLSLPFLPFLPSFPSSPLPPYIFSLLSFSLLNTLFYLHFPHIYAPFSYTAPLPFSRKGEGKCGKGRERCEEGRKGEGRGEGRRESRGEG